MAKLTIFHNARCSKSRETLSLLERSGKEFSVVNYLENPPTVAELERLTKQLSLAAEAIVRKKEPRFQELGLNENPPKSVAAWLKILSDNPILIERPIVTNGTRAVLGRPPENVLELLK